MKATNPKSHRAEVGRRLGVTIAALGLKQKEMVENFSYLGVTTSKLANWLRGEYYPNEWFLVNFCERYGITTDWLLLGRPNDIRQDVADALWKGEIEAIEAEKRPRKKPGPKPKRRFEQTAH